MQNVAQQATGRPHLATFQSFFMQSKNDQGKNTAKDMGYANAMSTENLEHKITKYVHYEITRLMCTKATHRNHNPILDVPTLKTEHMLSNANMNDTPMVENQTQEANQALTKQLIKQMIAEAL